MYFVCYEWYKVKTTLHNIITISANTLPF